jgi:ABC-type dipeptide/oligopeptide/nickel transport system ATPase subunit
VKVASKAILDVEALNMHFPVRKSSRKEKASVVRAVDDLSFQVFEGETLGIVGESGCGKTTMGRCINRILHPTSGTINYRLENGETVDLAKLTEKQLKPYRADIRMIFQDPFSSLNPRKNVLDIVGECLSVNGIAKGDERTKLVAGLLEKVGLRPEYMRRYPHSFSGGERQRIGIARAIALNPRIIVADEAVAVSEDPICDNNDGGSSTAAGSKVADIMAYLDEIDDGNNGIREEEGNGSSSVHDSGTAFPFPPALGSPSRRREPLQPNHQHHHSSPTGSAVSALTALSPTAASVASHALARRHLGVVASGSSNSVYSHHHTSLLAANVKQKVTAMRSEHAGLVERAAAAEDALNRLREVHARKASKASAAAKEAMDGASAVHAESMVRQGAFRQRLEGDCEALEARSRVLEQRVDELKASK